MAASVRHRPSLAMILLATSLATTLACAAHNRPAVVPPPEPAAPPAAVHKAPVEAPTPPEMPSFRESDEATSAQLGGALEEGKAVRLELEWVEAREAVSSGEMAAGEYLVTYLITPADDYYDLEAARSNFPAHHTTVLPGSAHVAVVVRDAADGRMVQGLVIHATLHAEDENGETSALLPYGWHPVLNRYGKNIVLPPSPFTLSVHIAMPSYSRSDRVNGDRFGRDVIARFEHVTVLPDSLAAASQRLAWGDSRDALTLAQSEGAAVDRPLAGLLRDPDASGAQVRAGEYRIAVVVDHARGDWEDHGGTLSFISPDSDAKPIMHMGVLVRDAVSGRLIPGLRVRATIINSRRKVIGTYPLDFTWHPWVSHYGVNVPVPGVGRYTIRVRADAPVFRRYGSGALKQFNKPIDVDVRGVRFVTAER
ncbi:MAG: hypothetical protein ABI338_07200 [Gemmatimonadaceae bacterium]